MGAKRPKSLAKKLASAVQFNSIDVVVYVVVVVDVIIQLNVTIFKV